jgi:hypothetical protein
MCWKSIPTTATTATTPSTTYACFTAIVTISFTVHGADDNSPYSEEPDEAKVSRPVRAWRRVSDGPADHNLASFLIYSEPNKRSQSYKYPFSSLLLYFPITHSKNSPALYL